MPAARRLKLPVPVVIVTGALASGKTTVLGGILRSKPQDEVWAVLINEFGAAGLDAALLAGGAAPLSGAGPAAADSSGLEGVHIKQLAGGCLCCALSNVTSLAIAQLLRSVKPDRLFIEPSGLAHPATLVDMLQGEHLGPSLALQPVVCLVDATQFEGGCAEPACCSVPLLADQISIADAVVGSKANLCSEEALQRFHRWAQGLFPPKRLVATARQGQLEAAAAEALVGRAAAHGQGNGSSSQAAQPAADSGALGLPVQRPGRAAGAPWLSSSAAEADEEAPRERPLRKEVTNAEATHAACGWIFHRDCLFSRPALLALLRALVPLTLRVKGVFRVSPKTWVAVSAAPTPAAAAAAAASADVELAEIAYRRDSRVEVIVDVATAAAANADGQEVSSGAAEPGVAQRVAGALRQAAAGDWTALEELLVAAQATPA